MENSIKLPKQTNKQKANLATTLGIYIARKWNQVLEIPAVLCSLFTTVNSWNQPNCPSTEKWIRKTWYLYTVEYYSASKKNAILSFGTWMDLEDLTFREIRQSQKQNNCMMSLTCRVWRGGNHRNSKMAGTRDEQVKWGRRWECRCWLKDTKFQLKWKV